MPREACLTVCKGQYLGSNASIVSILRAAGVLISGLSVIYALTHLLIMTTR